MTSGWPGRADQCREPPSAHAPSANGSIPLGPFDPTIIHRARAINADALRVIDELLDQIADSGRR